MRAGCYGALTKQVVENFQSIIDVEGGNLTVDGVYGLTARGQMDLDLVGGGCGFVGYALSIRRSAPEPNLPLVSLKEAQ